MTYVRTSPFAPPPPVVFQTPGDSVPSYQKSRSLSCLTSMCTPCSCSNALTFCGLMGMEISGFVCYLHLLARYQFAFYDVRGSTKEK